jgi:hypothetical protein
MGPGIKVDPNRTKITDEDMAGVEKSRRRLTRYTRPPTTDRAVEIVVRFVRLRGRQARPRR